MKLKKAAPAKKAVSVKQSREDKEEQRLLRSKRSMDAMEDYNAHEVSDVESEDDEDLDDDAAFNDSDEDRFGSHFAAASLAAKKAKTRTAVAEDDILNEDAASSKGRKRKGKEESEASEDEDEEEEEDWGSDAGDLVDLSDMLGSGPAKAVPVNPEYSLKKKPVFNKNDPASVLLAKHSDDSNSEDEDADSLYESDENNLNESGDQFQSFVSNLDAKHVAKKRRVTLAESTEAYTESEFNLNSRSKSSLGSAKLDFSDLVGSLGGDSTFTHLRKQLTELAPGAVNTGKPGLRAEGTEAAPLPTRIQDRIGRQAAYQSAKKEVEKWSGIISRNRKAEQLDFTTLEEKPAAIVSSAALVGQFKPTTDMEQEIAQLLKDSALDEKKQMELEDLEMNKLSQEEMIAKRQELVKLRSLAFYAEQKPKRFQKSKVKTYRKIHKKDALRKAAKDGSDLTLEELKDLDPDAAREKAEKLHADRIKERMTLKHKSTGKWARKMLARGDRGDEESRQALMDQLSQNQNLTRKIAGLESDEDSDALNSDSDDDLEGLDSGARAKKRGAAALADLEDQIARDHSEMESEAPKKGIFAMKFMQRGLERQMNESKQLLAEARQALEDEANEEDLDSDENVQTKKVTTKSKPKAVGVGRMVFGMQEEDDDDDEEDEEDENVKSKDARVSSSQFDMKMSKPVSISLDGTKNGFTVSKGTDVFSAKISNVQFGDEQPVPTKQSKKSKSTIAQAPIIAPTHPSATSKSQKSESSAAEDASNPWLATDTAFTKKSTKLNVTHADKAMERMNKLKSLQKASETADDMDFTLNLDGVRKLEVVKPQKQQPGKPSQVPSKAVPSAGKQETAIATTHSDSPTVYGPIKPTTATKPKPQKVISYDSEEDSDEEAVFNKISSNFIHSSDIKTLTQRELMQIAFANDNVATAEFEQEKTRTVEADAPEVVDNTLPGWGSWAGNGVEPKANLFTTVKTKVDSVVATKRKDAKLNHVIINEKKIRKAGKYLAKDLPFGYESREQYEQAIRMPLGVEWNTTASHARLTAPKVVTKMGTIIHPIKLAGNGASKEGEKKKTPGNKKGGKPKLK